VLLNASIGVDITHVPYRGAGASHAGSDGRAASTINVPPSRLSFPQIESNPRQSHRAVEKGPVRRSCRHWQPRHEQGLTDFEGPSRGTPFFLPKGTPKAIVQKLNEVTVATMNMPAVQQRLKEVGSEPVAPDRRSPEYLQGFVVSEIKKWAAAV